MKWRLASYQSLLGRFQHDVGLFVLRVYLGASMLVAYGLGKAQLLFTSPAQFADPIGFGPEFTLLIAVFAEVFCAGLIVLGAFTRLAALPLIATMAAAAFVVHAGDPFAERASALLYLSGFVALFFTGAGRWSVDQYLSATARKRAKQAAQERKQRKELRRAA